MIEKIILGVFLGIVFNVLAYGWWYATKWQPEREIAETN